MLGNVEEGVAGTKALIERYHEVAVMMAVAYSDDLLEEMGRLQEELDHRDAWDLDSRVDQTMDALRYPPPGAQMSVLSGGGRQAGTSRNRPRWQAVRSCSAGRRWPASDPVTERLRRCARRPSGGNRE